MNFSDIFKQSFLEGYSGDLSSANVIASLLITSLLALYVFFIYRLVTRKAFYSRNFNIALAAVSVITAAIILTVQSNIVISLGMVGALSIVRYRTAIKEPMDLMFLFWSISIGIICGAGLAEIAVLLSLILTAGVFLLDRLPMNRVPLMLVVNADDIDAEDAVMKILADSGAHHKVKSRNYAKNRLDLIVEVRLKDERSCVRQISSLPGVLSVSLLSHDGEVTY